MKKIYIGIFIISIATLALEISLLRLFSISQFYHFAFMVVSIAMFGIAAAGTFLSIKKLKNPLFISSLLFAFSVIISFFILNKISFDPYKAILRYTHLFRLIPYYILLGLPFFFFGIIIAYSLVKYKNQVGKIYFYNLFGSALGSLVVIPLLFLGEKIIIIIALLGLVSCLFFNHKHVIKIIALMIITSLLFFLPFDIHMSEYKDLSLALNYPNAEHLLTKYNYFSRVDIVNSSFTRYAPGLSPSFKGTLPPQLGLTIDGADMNAITSPKTFDFFSYLPTTIGFYLLENPKTLILNSGAGLDVLNAYYHNATITALETNPLVIKLLQNEYKDFSGNLYNKVTIIQGYGRAFVKQNKKYDIIILSLSGNVLSSSTGLYSLSENYLLTKEAFREYYNHLTDNGFLVITRWLSYPPRESLRLFSLALEVENAEEKIALFRSWTTVTLVLSKEKLNEDKIKEFCEKNKFDLIYLPSNFTPNRFGRFKEPYYYNAVNHLLKNKDYFYKHYIFDVTSVSDNKPFYFNFFKWSKIKELNKLIGTNWQPFFDSGFLVLFILIQALILSVIFILLPIRIYKKVKTKHKLVYFFCIGLSYLFIEIFFIQKYFLLFGQIIYSTSLVIFSMLLFSSLGSLYSQRIKNLNRVIISIGVLVLIYLIFLPMFIAIVITFPLFFKVITSFIIIAPLAFLMGIPFPMGLRLIKKELIAWAFAINGSASVLSSIIAVLVALSFGYSSVFLFAGILYLCGLWFIKKV